MTPVTRMINWSELARQYLPNIATQKAVQMLKEYASLKHYMVDEVNTRGRRPII